MSIVKVSNLRKEYQNFRLNNISFSVKQGRITGFIGRNGAGKTTTIKSILNFVHPDGGEISYFGLSLTSHESDIKKRIGYSTGTVSWYPRKKIKNIVNIVKKFYEHWDDESCRKYLNLFDLDENKTPRQLSAGMKVKFNLLIALSHGAKILILDEPTSGLDPFSRDELLSIFSELKARGVAIFFSTHIISDLEKCADDIVYISKGDIVAALPKADFVAKHSRRGESLEETIVRMERAAKNA